MDVVGTGSSFVFLAIIIVLFLDCFCHLRRCIDPTQSELDEEGDE